MPTITPARLTSARATIEEMTSRQVDEGRQSRELPAGFKSCGQFLGEPNRPQRGLHGVAAAIETLKYSRQPERDSMLAQLVEYLANRPTLDPDKSPHDASNTIKCSELLHALVGLPASVAPVTTADQLKRLTDRLRRCANATGWSYYLVDGESPQLLSTLFALRALDAANEQVDERLLRHLIHKVTNKPSAIDEPADFSVRIFGLHVLAGLQAIELSKHVKKSLRRSVIDTWHSVEGLLEYDIEANIEYSDPAGNHHYVRVPWQLYLIGAAARLSPLRVFATTRMQRRLKSVVDAVHLRGFHYPHSGREVSTRTAAIIYEILGLAGDRYKGLGALRFGATALDGIRRALTARGARMVYLLAAVLVSGVSVWNWYQNDGAVADLAPDLVTAILLALLGGISRRP